jgi:hypothetical protein
MVKPLEFSVVRKESGLEHIMFIMGWGNDFDQPGIKWFVDLLSEANYSVVTVRIPTRIQDYREEIIEPVLRLHEELGDPIVIAHSMGAIAGRYIVGSRKRIFLSPYWGIAKHRYIPYMRQVLTSLRWMGIPLFPRGYEREHLGDLTTEKDAEAIPRRLSVRTIYQFWKAQEEMPPIESDDAIYYTLSDIIVDLDRIEDAPCRKVVYQGGHAFFTSGSRDWMVHDLLYNIRSS